jgi:acyl dehydratase
MNAVQGYDIEDLNPGMTASFAKTVTEADILMYASVSCDFNAVHLCEEFRADTIGRREGKLFRLDRASRAWCTRVVSEGTQHERA